MPERIISCIDSGATYRLLRTQAQPPASGVLALGDPDYGTRRDPHASALRRGSRGPLAPLPATRDEVLAVGTRTLLGPEANETALRAALTEAPRWRAVHLACHGLLDAERPALSSLALSPGGEADDGYLTCVEIFRLRVPADLVVLSACETGRGRVLRAEGVVGFTRAFLFAGAPRVIGSLWNVDDEATAALMRRFYALWNPPEGGGLAPAAALRQAQDHVCAQARWAHPYYWAAWVLWGLPD
jgi:CHAT domain-containing protein